MISPQVLALINKLSDGAYHSGEALGKESGVSRAAIWKNLQSLAPLGLDVASVRGKGYRLTGGLDLLDATKLRTLLSEGVSDCVGEIEVFSCLDSTNKYLLDRVAMKGPSGPGSACLSEMQTAGRGRRGRHWQSPFGRNIYLSLSWPFSGGVSSLEGLSLAVGVVVARVLEKWADSEIKLKWPNDIVSEEAKLGGILIELAGNALDDCQAVIGLGLNVDVPKALMNDVDQPWTDLKHIASELPSRTMVAAELIESLVNLLAGFESEGFQPYRSAWESRHAFANAPVVLSAANRQVVGIALGVTDKGALRLLVDAEEEHFVGGEVSLRSHR